MLAKDIMTTNVATVAPDTTVEEILRWSHIVGQLGGEVKVYSAC